MPDYSGGSEKHHICSNCGEESTAAASYCAACGNPLAEAPEEGQGARRTESVGSASANPAPMPTPGVLQSHRRGGFGRVGWVVIVIVIAGAVALGYVLALHHSSSATASSTISGAGTPSNGQNTQTPEQQFANDASSQIDSVKSDLADGTFTLAQLKAYGDDVCNYLAQNPNDVPQQYQSLIYSIIPRGVSFPQMSETDAKTFIGLAITDVCPTYQPDIPYGNPGAS
jgi:ribosomal protein L37E